MKLSDRLVWVAVVALSVVAVATTLLAPEKSKVVDLVYGGF